jgi:hypothetical protein
VISLAENCYVFLQMTDDTLFANILQIKNLASSPQQAQPKTAPRNICLGMNLRIELTTMEMEEIRTLKQTSNGCDGSFCLNLSARDLISSGPPVLPSINVKAGKFLTTHLKARLKVICGCH